MSCRGITCRQSRRGCPSGEFHKLFWFTLQVSSDGPFLSFQPSSLWRWFPHDSFMQLVLRKVSVLPGEEELSTASVPSGLNPGHWKRTCHFFAFLRYSQDVSSTRLLGFGVAGDQCLSALFSAQISGESHWSLALARQPGTIINHFYIFLHHICSMCRLITPQLILAGEWVQGWFFWVKQDANRYQVTLNLKKLS